MNPPQQKAPLSPQEKLNQAIWEHEKWSRVAASPNLSPQAAAWARNAAKSALAKVTLRQKALAYQSAVASNRPEKRITHHDAAIAQMVDNKKADRLVFAWKQIKYWALPALIFGWIIWTFAPLVAMAVAVTLFAAGIDKLIEYWRTLGQDEHYRLEPSDVSSLAGPRSEAWFFSLPPGQDVHVPALQYAGALDEYRSVAKKMLEWKRDPSQQPEKVDLQPLLIRMRSTEILFSRPLIARYDGEQTYQFPDPLGCIRVKRTVDGVVSALFLAGELPTVSAWDHGLYDRDYELITTDAELLDALADLDPEKLKSIGIPAGLRMRRDSDTLIGKCLLYSFIEGFADLAVQIGPGGVATKLGLETVLRPEGKRFY